MKRQYIPLIIFFMSSALLGLAIVQWYWVRDAIRLKQSYFDSQVHSALVAAVHQEEKKQTAQNVRSRLPKISSHTPPLPPSASVPPVAPAPPQNNSTAPPRFKIDIRQDSVEVADQFGSLKKQIRLQVSSQTSGFFENSQSTTTTRITSSQTISSSDTQDFFKYRKELIDEMISDMFTLRQPFYKSIDTTSLYKTLLRQFRIRGIEANFVFGIAEEDTEEHTARFVFVNNHDKLNSIRESTQPYRTALFPNNPFAGNYTLVVHFPDRSREVAGRLALQLLLALSLMGIVVFSFTYTVRTFYKQKKLSDIKDDFISNITHEFKTPLSTISLACQMIESPAAQKRPDATKRYIGMISEENRRLQTMVEKLLETSLLDNDKIKFKPEMQDVHSLIYEVVEQFELKTENTAANVELQLQAGNDTLLVDTFHFTHVVYNLIDNAFKYGGDHPHIIIKSYNRRDTWLLEVIDHGIGISKENQAHIFEKFYRVPSGNVHNVKGFGLGLSYVKKIVDLHDGEITLKSIIDQGTTFRLAFQVYKS